MQRLVFFFKLVFQLWPLGVLCKSSYVFYFKTNISLELQILDGIFLLSTSFNLLQSYMGNKLLVLFHNF